MGGFLDDGGLAGGREEAEAPYIQCRVDCGHDYYAGYVIVHYLLVTD